MILYTAACGIQRWMPNPPLWFYTTVKLSRVCAPVGRGPLFLKNEINSLLGYVTCISDVGVDLDSIPPTDIQFLRTVYANDKFSFTMTDQSNY